MVKNETPVKALSFVVHVKITVEIQQSKVCAMGLKIFLRWFPPLKRVGMVTVIYMIYVLQGRYQGGWMLVYNETQNI